MGRRSIDPKYAPMPRANETVGGGNVVFKRGTTHGRLHPTSWPFEHASLGDAQAEAERLADLTGETFEVWARVETVAPVAAFEVDAAGGMPVEVCFGSVTGNVSVEGGDE